MEALRNTMRLFLATLLVLALLFVSSCSMLQEDNVRNTDLDKLLRDFDFSLIPASSFEPETDGNGFPIELLNELKKAVQEGSSDKLIYEMNDESLMINAEDFVFVPNESDGIDISEEQLNEYFAKKNSSFLFYKCNLTGDGNDSIIMIENNRYDFSGSNKAYLLNKSGDSYVYAGYDFLGYYRTFAIFEYENRIFLIANYDDYQTRLTKGIGLFDLSDPDTTGFMWLEKKSHVYIRKTNADYTYNLLYQNDSPLIIDAVQSYVDSIQVDLIYADRKHNGFFGDETARDDLLESARKDDPENILKLWNIYSIDVDNDGCEEYFDRKIIYYGGSDLRESKARWHDIDKGILYPSPFSIWTPAEYYLTQIWFKVIDGQTVVFSLYHKNSEDIYLLDARMSIDGETIILLDYVVTLAPKAELTDYWDYESDVNFIRTDYRDPDFKKAFPETIDDQIDVFAAQVQSGFVPVDHQDDSIPNDLIVMLEQALFDGIIDSLDLASTSLEIDAEDFYEMFERQAKQPYKDYDSWYDNKGTFLRFIQHIYRYELDSITYYLLVFDSGGSARFADIQLLKESDGTLIKSDYLIALDFNSRVVLFDNKPYLICKYYNYNTKFVDTIIVYSLVQDGIGDPVQIKLSPTEYQWKLIYSNGQPSEETISDYVSGIVGGLVGESPINGYSHIYADDETVDFDHNVSLRLKSVGGNYDSYYEIDFNNDGIAEYIYKQFWYPSNGTRFYLMNTTYLFSGNRIISTNSAFDVEGMMLVQLWFKVIEGKTFTFRLFLVDGYNYVLNVSFIEDTDITQVQSYIIVPDSQFVVTSKIGSF